VTFVSNSGPLVGRVAVVTGGGRGLGRAISQALARSGATVHVVARTASQLDETVGLIQADGGVAIATAVDLTGPEAVFNVLKPRVEGQSGPPDILVNAAGIYGPVALVADSDPREWIETINVNLIASYLVCRAFVGGMIAQRWGRIVNVTSAASLHPPGPLNSAYAASKVALNQLTRTLAAELIGTGVTANVIHPGEVKTDMWRSIKARAETLGPIGEPLRAWAREVERTGGDPPERAAELVLSLVGDESGGISGQFHWIREGIQKPIPADWGA
jgi:NAD(P)-dependent dehydrogenase (short-subunit alcohol dehydrogenase family)